jgi:hypothetical protein
MLKLVGRRSAATSGGPLIPVGVLVGGDVRDWSGVLAGGDVGDWSEYHWLVVMRLVGVWSRLVGSTVGVAALAAGRRRYWQLVRGLSRDVGGPLEYLVGVMVGGDVGDCRSTGWW